MWKGFVYIFFNHTYFLHKMLIFLVIYTDFVLDQSGRSVYTQQSRNFNFEVEQELSKFARSITLHRD